MKEVYRKGVFIIVYSVNNSLVKYLLLKRKKHWKGWEFPKGGIELFESKKEAVVRELKEETGCSPIILKSYSIKGKYKYDKKYPDRPGLIGQTYTLFAVQVKSKKAKIDKKEHSAFKWIDFDTAFKMLKWPNQKVCLNYVNKSIKQNEI